MASFILAGWTSQRSMKDGARDNFFLKTQGRWKSRNLVTAQKITKLTTCQTFWTLCSSWNILSFPAKEQPLSAYPSLLNSHLDAKPWFANWLGHNYPETCWQLLRSQLDAAHNQKELNCPLLGAAQSAGQPPADKCIISRWRKLWKWEMNASRSLLQMDCPAFQFTVALKWDFVFWIQTAFLLPPSEIGLFAPVSSQVYTDWNLHVFLD